MIGGDPVAGAREAARVIADDVFAQAARAAEAGRDRQIVRGGELDQFLAADDRHPDRRARLLHRARPQRHILVAPELAAVGKHLLGPRPGDDLERLVEAGARLRQRHVVDLVFARDAAGKAGDQPPVRHAIEHRQLFGQPQRLVQRQQIAVDQELQVLGALCRRRGQQVGRVHQPVGRAMMLVEPDPVIAEPVELLPGVEMLGIGARRDFGLEMLASPADKAARRRPSDARAARHKPRGRKRTLSCAHLTLPRRGSFPHPVGGRKVGARSPTRGQPANYEPPQARSTEIGSAPQHLAPTRKTPRKTLTPRRLSGGGSRPRRRRL